MKNYLSCPRKRHQYKEHAVFFCSTSRSFRFTFIFIIRKHFLSRSLTGDFDRHTLKQKILKMTKLGSAEVLNVMYIKKTGVEPKMKNRFAKR